MHPIAPFEQAAKAYPWTHDAPDHVAKPGIRIEYGHTPHADKARLIQPAQFADTAQTWYLAVQANNSIVSFVLVDCQSNTMKPRLTAAVEAASAFLSFSMRDKILVASFKVAIAKTVPSLVLLEHPIRELYDKDWQFHCGRKIDQSTMLICLIGSSTYRSKAVAWEISTGISLGKRVIAVELIDGASPLPDILKKNAIAPIRGSDDNAFSHVAQIIEFAYP